MKIKIHSAGEVEVEYPYAARIAGGYLYCKNEKNWIFFRNEEPEGFTIGHSWDQLMHFPVFEILDAEETRDMAETIILHAQQILR